jgi:hypothetical protein
VTRVRTALPFRRHLTVAAIIVAGLTTLVPTLAVAESGERRVVRSLLEMRREKVVVQDWGKRAQGHFTTWSLKSSATQ